MSNLKNQVMNGLKWSFLAKMTTQVFSWISTFVVLRLLTPDDYGLMSIAMVFFTFISMFTNNGLISALVRMQSTAQKESSQIFTLSLLINLSLSGLLAIMAPSIADWYDNQQLKNVLWVLAAINPITTFAVIPQAKLQIEMRFKEKSLAEGVAALAAALTAFVAANLEQGFWALIYSNIVLNIVRVVGFNFVARVRYGIAKTWDGAKELFLFAMHIQLGTFIWFAYNKADTIIIARFLGVDKAGIYNVAGDVASIPMSKINAIMNEVAFSAFTKTKDDLEAAKKYLQKAVKMMGAITFPMFYGIAAISNEMVLLLLGEQWKEAAPIIALLCLILPLRMVSSVMNNYAIGMGETKFGVVNAGISASIIISAIFIGVQFGLNETALAWVLSYVLVYAILIFRFRSRFNLKITHLFGYWPALAISISMLLVIELMDLFFISPMSLSLIFSISIKIAVGVAISAPPLYFIYGKEMLQLFKK